LPPGGIAGFVGVRYLAPATVLLACGASLAVAALALVALDRQLGPGPGGRETVALAGTD